MNWSHRTLQKIYRYSSCNACSLPWVYLKCKTLGNQQQTFLPKKKRNLTKKIKENFIIFLFFRKNEWMFASDVQPEWLRKSSNMTRLAVVIFHRGHEFPEFESSSEGTQGCANQLPPKDVLGQVCMLMPIIRFRWIRWYGILFYLSVDTISFYRRRYRRETIVFSFHSETSGDFVVEVRGGANNKRIFRRLNFLSSPYIIQFVARLKKG